MGEKLCLVAPDMQELMTDQLDENQQNCAIWR